MTIWFFWNSIGFRYEMANENDKLSIANGKFTELKKENQNSVLLSLYWTFETVPLKMHFFIDLILKTGNDRELHT